MSLKRKNKTLGKLLTQLGCLTPAFHLPEWQDTPPSPPRPYLTSSEIPTSASSLLPRTPVSLLWKQTSLRWPTSATGCGRKGGARESGVWTERPRTPQRPPVLLAPPPLPPPTLGVEILLQSRPPPTALRPCRDFASKSQHLTCLSVVCANG